MLQYVQLSFTEFSRYTGDFELSISVLNIPICTTLNIQVSFAVYIKLNIPVRFAVLIKLNVHVMFYVHTQA